MFFVLDEFGWLVEEFTSEVEAWEYANSFEEYFYVVSEEDFMASFEDLDLRDSLFGTC